MSLHLRPDTCDVYLLWTLHQCRYYKTSLENAVMVGVSEKTFSDKIKYLIGKIADLTFQLESILYSLSVFDHFFCLCLRSTHFFSDPLFFLLNTRLYGSPVLETYWLKCDPTSLHL